MKNVTYKAAEKAAKCLRTIAHPSRIQIIGLLLNKELPVSEICEKTGLTQPATSEHLRRMEAKGILSCERRGKQIFYQTAMNGLEALMDCIRDHGLE